MAHGLSRFLGLQRSIRLSIPRPNSSPASSSDSLFDSDSDDECNSQGTVPLKPCSIPGLYLFLSAVPVKLQHSLAASLSETVWTNHSDQVMLFTSIAKPHLPPFLSPLLKLLPSILTPRLPSKLLDSILHSTLPRQAILNLYPPGTGISPHIDLPHRYEEGIVGISLGGSTVMEFERDGDCRSILLRPGDIYVLSGAARYDWKHGIAYRHEDLLTDGNGETYVLKRRLRMSITLRRLTEGAEVVGDHD